MIQANSPERHSVKETGTPSKHNQQPCKPEIHDGEVSCSYCRHLRRPCTWHTVEELNRREWQRLSFMPKDDTGPVIIPRPTVASIVEVEEHEHGVEDDDDDDDSDEQVLE